MRRHQKNYKNAEEIPRIDLVEGQSTTFIIKTDQIAFDFSRWLYLGRPKFDKHSAVNSSNPVKFINANRYELVSAMFDAISGQQGRWRSSTLANICNSLAPFFEFLDQLHNSENAVREVNQITLSVIEKYIEWLLHYRTVNTKTRRHSYSGAKSIFSPFVRVLDGLVNMGLIEPEAIPRNPFPNHRRSIASSKPYSKNEMNSILSALKADLESIREGKFIGGDSDVLTIYFFLLAARTGKNFTPLLNLSRNSLSDHPIKPDEWVVLTSYKYRGYSVHQQIIKKRTTNTELMTVPADVETLFREVLAYTNAMAIDIGEKSDGHLWLYRTRGGRNHKYGKVLLLTEAALKHGISRFSSRHQLLPDDSPSTGSERKQLLMINVRRLRATFVNRMWKLTGGDIVSTAVLAGNTPIVTNSHYLDLTPDMQKKFKFVGHAYELFLKGETGSKQARCQMKIELGIDEEALSLLLSGYHNTGTARCSDPLQGRYAPKNGTNYCNLFLYCFRCPNQVILENDLHRLYSFYWLIYRERHYLQRSRWKTNYGWVIEVVNNEIAPRFKTKAVREAKALAYKTPHPMWRTREMLQADFL